MSAQQPQDALLDEALTLIVRIHSGETTAPSQGDLDLWAGRSPAHAAAAAEARALWSTTGALRPMRDRAGNLSRRGLLLGGVGLLGAGGWAWRGTSVPGEIATGTAETRAIALADGSQIELSARSGIDLGKPPGRQAALRAGQAWFEIRRAAQPFRISAGALRLELEQGMLDLDMRAGDGGAIVALGSHPARLAGFGGALLAAGGVYRLRPGQVPEPLPRRAADSFAWRTGKLVAEEIPLGEIIATLNDWHPGWIRLADAGLAQLPVTAVLDLRRPEAALRSLERGLPLRLRSLGGVILNLERA